jgi:hypothetical protein
VNSQLVDILTDALKLIAGILIGFLIGEPLKRLGQRLFNKREEQWDRGDRVDKVTHARPLFRVTQLCMPGSPFDFTSLLKEQNRIQNVVHFEVDDFRRYPLPEEAAELQNQASKKTFLDQAGAILARSHGEAWQGLSDQLPDPHYKGRRDLVLTNIPLPGNFYAWNSKDRNLLVISIASVNPLFPRDGKPTIEDFVLRMTQRMTIFALISSLDPLQAHGELSSGCLFDFNILLRGVVDVVKNPYICPACGALIRRQRGDEFYEELSEWIEKAPVIE